MTPPQHFAWLAVNTVQAGQGAEPIVEFSCILTDKQHSVLDQMHHPIRGEKHPHMLMLEVPARRRAALEAVGLWEDLPLHGITTEAADRACAALLKQVPGPVQAIAGPTAWRDQHLLATHFPHTSALIGEHWIDAFSIQSGIAAYVPTLKQIPFNPDTRTVTQTRALMGAYATTLNVLKGA